MTIFVSILRLTLKNTMLIKRRVYSGNSSLMIIKCTITQTNKCNKSTGTMKKLSLTLSRNSLLTIYKTFVRPILNYVDI